jgi:hypothetical protein
MGERTLGGVALQLALIVGCTTEAGPPASTCCVSDPAPHPVLLVGCHGDGECPSGTECTTGPNEPVLPASICGGADLSQDAGVPSHCEPVQRPPSALSQLLASGFAVPQMDAQLVANAGASSTLRWVAPGGTRSVECAAFGCVPLVRPVGARAGMPISQIVNAGQCSLGTVTTAPGGTTSLDALLPLIDDAAPTEQGCTRSERHLTGLFVGCWAIDDARVIGATPLFTVQPTDLEEQRRAYWARMSCDSGTEGMDCIIDSNGSYGTCHESRCRFRCFSRLDCRVTGTAVVLGDGGPGSVTVVDPGPCIERNNYLGVCVEEGAP